MIFQKPTAAAIVLATSTCLAHAADLPMRSAPPVFVPPPPIFTWSGFYIGGYAGGVFGSAKMLDLPFPAFINGNKFDPAGATAGGLLGYNYQVGALVLGIEGDGGYNGVTTTQNFTSGGGGLRNEKFDGGYIARVRGRVGYAINDLLLFAAGGVSFADAREKFLNPGNGFTESLTKSYTGFNVGGGAEYALTSNWIGRLEYIYDDLGTKTFGFPTSPTGFDARRTSFSENTVRLGAEYKF